MIEESEITLEKKNKMWKTSKMDWLKKLCYHAHQEEDDDDDDTRDYKYNNKMGEFGSSVIYVNFVI